MTCEVCGTKDLVWPDGRPRTTHHCPQRLGHCLACNIVLTLDGKKLAEIINRHNPP